MTRKNLSVVMAALFGIVPTAATADSEAAARALAPPSQSLTLEQVRQAEQAQQSRGDFSSGKYTTTYLLSSEFVNNNDGTAPIYFSEGYRDRGTSVGTGSEYRAALHLPQGARACYIGIYYYDSNTTPGDNVKVEWADYSGFDSTNLPNVNYRESAESPDATNAGFGYASAMIDPFQRCIGVPPNQICLPPSPRCRTINNDVMDRGGGGLGYSYELVVTLPVASSTLRFKAADVRWYRQIAAAPTAATFTDVPTTYWAFQQIEALKASGISTGTTATTFSPSNTVTRAEMAVFLARALGLYWPD